MRVDVPRPRPMNKEIRDESNHGGRGRFGGRPVPAGHPHGPASATPVPINLKNVIGTTPGSVELVRQGGGGGGGGGHGGGGGRYSGGGGGGGGAAIRGGGGGGPRVGAGPRGGGNFANRSGGRNYTGQRSYAGRNIDRSGPRASRDYGGDRGRYADRNRGDHRRYAERGRDNNHNNIPSSRLAQRRVGVDLRPRLLLRQLRLWRRLLLAAAAGLCHRQPLLVVAL